MPKPNIICLAIDRLHVGYLGAYGNTWISTPAIDRLASDSLVLDRMMIDSPRLETIYRSLWYGLHAMCPASREQGIETLPSQLTKNGWQTALITDDPTIGQHLLAREFAERNLLSSSQLDHSDDLSVVDEIEETHAAAFFAEAINWLEKSPQQPFFLWLHTGTLGHVWDAPQEFRAQYHDEDDPPPGKSATTPNRLLTGDVDPDELLGLRHAYAGQVSMIDQMVGSLIDAIDQSPSASDTILVVFSTRGFPLAEHRRIGQCDDALYAELTHMPCFVRLPLGVAASHRCQALVQPADMFATILELALGTAPATEWISGRGRSIVPLMRGTVEDVFDRSVAKSGENEFRIETPAWAMRSLVSLDSESMDSSKSDAAPQVELFVKPDDWCEVNEVSDRCPRLAEELQAVLAKFRQGCEIGEPGKPAALAEELVSRLE